MILEKKKAGEYYTQKFRKWSTSTYVAMMKPTTIVRGAAFLTSDIGLQLTTYKL